VTCVYDGESDTETVSGTGTVAINQNGCNVSYVPPNINAPRVGKIEGNAISFSGSFVVPLVGGVNFSQNIVTLKGPIIDEQDFTLNGSGIATGTVEGVGFKCTEDSTAKFKRCYDVAVAVLHGGPIPLPPPFSEREIANALRSIEVQAIQQDPKRVVAAPFPAAGSATQQLSKVGEWLDKVNRECDNAAKVILIGHSYGGDAVRQSNFSKNMCSRITIDPINPGAWVLHSDQRNLEPFHLTSTAGRFINVLASSEEWNGLLGYRIADTVEGVEPVTNHKTIITRVLERRIVASEVQRCLE
jgi:hypothetical protein